MHRLFYDETLNFIRPFGRKEYLWSIKHRFQNGIYKLGYTPYGYDWDDKNMIINPEQAAVVKRIFADILSGKSTNAIADELNAEKGSDKQHQRYAFSGKIICGECGDTFKCRIHSCTTYKYVAWACNTHLKDKESCHMKYVRNDKIKAAFITMLNKLIYGYRLILTPYLKVLENSSDDEAIHRIQHLEQLIAQNSEQREALTKLMAQGYIDQILYNQETNALSCRQRHIALTLKQLPSE